ncbi:MAG TPA: hypothetical protein VJ719_13070 [Chthoniobacterales bacterium]|nr:hypothetical protein [Chthoniobacterales bacterium]
MKRYLHLETGIFATRIISALALAAIGISLGMLSFARQTTASATAANGAGPGFHAPVAMPGSNAGTEPSLAIPLQIRAGLRFVTWQNPGEIATSLDGVNFTNRGSRTGGGDVTNASDPSGALFFGQFCSGAFMLHACLERSPDGGLTWPLHTDIADMHPGAADRPWIETYPHKRPTIAEAQSWNPDNTRVYVEYHTFSPEELAYVTVSADGGHTFSEAKLITSDTNALVASGCNTVPGGVAVDQNNGTVYALWLSGNDVASSTLTGCNYSQIGPFNKAWVSRSTDGGNTWTATLAWQGAFDLVTKIGDNADKIFATLAVDDAGQVHVILPVRHNDDPLGFASDCQINPNCVETPNDTDLLIVTSPDGGLHWTLPANIENNSGSYFFPWAAAGSRGIVNVVYYKSTTRQPNRADNIWFVGHTRVTGAVATYTSGANATYSSAPQFAETLLDSGPIHGNGTSGGGICTFGVFCSAVPGANRTLADSLAVTLDPAGGVNAVWTDAVGNPGGAKEIHFACQNSGASSLAGAPDLNGCYGPADMAITKVGSPAAVSPGGTLTYHITVTNNGTPAMPATTSGVTVTDTLPAGATLVSATPSQGTCSGTTTVVCDLGIFPSGASTTIDIQVTAPNTTGTLTNTATVFALTDDPSLSNNTATVATTVDPFILSRTVSRKTHGAAGDFDIPITGPAAAVECRSGGDPGTYNLVYQFTGNVSVPGTASKISGTGLVGLPVRGTQPNEVIVPLRSVANANQITVNLSGVQDGFGRVLNNQTAKLEVLVGDATNNRAVSNTDVAEVKAQVSAVVDGSNFRNDVTANGAISNTDVSTTKAQVGTSLP